MSGHIRKLGNKTMIRAHRKISSVDRDEKPDQRCDICGAGLTKKMSYAQHCALEHSGTNNQRKNNGEEKN